jgi:hypothetical protein
MDKSIPNAYVFLANYIEYLNYINLCEENGLIWPKDLTGSYVYLYNRDIGFCISIDNTFTPRSKSFCLENGATIYTLDELKKVWKEMEWIPKYGEEVDVIVKGIKLDANVIFIAEHNDRYVIYNKDTDDYLDWKKTNVYKKSNEPKYEIVNINGQAHKVTMETFEKINILIKCFTEDY